MSERTPRWERGSVAVMVVVAVVVTWWATARWGLGLTHDSVAYVATAQRIVDGRGGGYWLDPTMTLWPLGYPTLIAAVMKLGGGGPQSAARWLQIALVGLNVVVVWRVAVLTVRQSVSRVALVGAIGLSTVALGFGRMALVETASMLLASTTLWWMVRRSQRLNATTALVAAALASVAWLIHYRNIVIPAAVGVFALIMFDVPLRRRVRFTALFVALSAVVPAAYAWWNVSRGGSAVGVRPTVQLTVSDWTRTVGSITGGWILGRPAQAGFGIALGLIAVIAAVVLLIVGRRESTPAAHAFRFAVLLFLAMCAMRVLVSFDLDGRTMSATFAPVMLGAAASIEARLARRPFRALVGAWSVVVVALSLVAAAQFHRSGSGGSSAAFATQREALAGAEYLASLEGCSVTSNRPQMLWLATRAEVPYFSAERAADPRGCVVVISGFFDVDVPTGWGCVYRTEGISVYRADRSDSTGCEPADTPAGSG